MTTINDLLDREDNSRVLTTLSSLEHGLGYNAGEPIYHNFTGEPGFLAPSVSEKDIYMVSEEKLRDILSYMSKEAIDDFVKRSKHIYGEDMFAVWKALAIANINGHDESVTQYVPVLIENFEELRSVADELFDKISESKSYQLPKEYLDLRKRIIETFRGLENLQRDIESRPGMQLYSWFHKMVTGKDLY